MVVALSKNTPGKLVFPGEGGGLSKSWQNHRNFTKRWSKAAFARSIRPGQDEFAASNDCIIVRFISMVA
jgi:hypothetical protein